MAEEENQDNMELDENRIDPEEDKKKHHEAIKNGLS